MSSLRYVNGWSKDRWSSGGRSFYAKHDNGWMIWVSHGETGGHGSPRRSVYGVSAGEGTGPMDSKSTVETGLRSRAEAEAVVQRIMRENPDPSYPVRVGGRF